MSARPPLKRNHAADKRLHTGVDELFEYFSIWADILRQKGHQANIESILSVSVKQNFGMNIFGAFANVSLYDSWP